MKEENFKNNPDYILVKQKLEKHKDFRERSKRNPFLSVLALRKLGINVNLTSKKEMTMDDLAEFSPKYLTYDRWWRKVLEQPENEHLRGTDYYSKEELESLQRNKMGYTNNQ